MSNLFFPKKTLNKMQSIGISEHYIYDIFHSGTAIKGKNGLYKKYPGYEVGLFYKLDNQTGEYHIIAVWKKDRR